MNTDCNIELDYIDKRELLYVHIDIFTSSSCRKRRWTSSDVCDMTPFLTPFFLVFYWARGRVLQKTTSFRTSSDVFRRRKTSETSEKTSEKRTTSLKYKEGSLHRTLGPWKTQKGTFPARSRTLPRITRSVEDPQKGDVLDVMSQT